jgi:alpha-beta hydrolase superfamily lysophospholipase
MDVIDIRSDSTGWIPVDDGVRLFVRRWASLKGEPRAILHVVHGMAEHSLRYERLAEKLCAEGIEVWVADLRGHGYTGDPKVNDPGKGGLKGHCADKAGETLVTADIDAVNRFIRERRPGLPLFLMGHSWGSFLVQNYIESYGGLNTGTGTLAGCVLSGTRGPDGIKIRFGAPFMAFISRLTGPRRFSAAARAVADGPYNKPFRPNRTSFDWLSRDKTEVDRFIDDPLCGTLCSAGFYRDLIGLLDRIHRPECMVRIDRRLPFYIFAGSADPVGEMGASPTALVEAYRAMGVQDIEFVLYPDARHETLNETNRDEVMENLLTWILKHLPKEPLSSTRCGYMAAQSN